LETQDRMGSGCGKPKSDSATGASLVVVSPAPAQAEPAAAPLPPAGPVEDYAKGGPLYGRLKAPPPPEEWARHGATILKQLAGPDVPESAASAPPSELPEALAVRVYRYYLPIYFWVRAQVGELRAARNNRAVIVGLSAPQGCGKTTVVELLVALFAADGLRMVSVSSDDFYLTGAEQDKVAESVPTNGLWQVRGNAGTHDIAFGEATLKAMIATEPGTVAVPRYDKSARGGKGDRAVPSKFVQEKTPLDVILFEGWMSGFKSRGEGDADALAAIHEGLPAVDAKLKGYQVWDDYVDCWAVIALEDKKHVFEWRLQAEHAMAAANAKRAQESGEAGKLQRRNSMSDDAVRDFVSRYMPAYEAYCPTLYTAAKGPGVDGKPTMMVTVDGDRSPVTPQP